MVSNEAIRVGMAAGLRLAVLSEHMLPPERLDLVTLPVTGLPIESHWQFIVRRDRRLSHSALGFLRIAEGHLGKYVEARFLCTELAGLIEGLAADKRAP
ncbi:LysR substrate-binding domain-containing protein [Halomonas sp. H10-9-1]|uniref:LysR substrate-binding domain-containing protein n=1 Tax=Halomonas sp. H10-9-1 TaxID=2950871 RepID=UPI0032DF427F